MIWLPEDERAARERRKLKIVAFPGPATDAVNFFRMGGPAAFLRERGHKVMELHPESGLTDEQQAELVREADVVWGVQPAGWFDERHQALKETKAAIVVDCDDNLFAWHDDPASSEPWTKAAEDEVERQQGVRPSTRERVEQFRTWLRGADLVVTTTERLAGVFRAEGAKSVTVCPNGLFHSFKRTRPRPQDVVAVRGERAARVLAKAVKRFEVPSGLPPAPSKRVAWTGSIAHKADLPPALAALRRLLELDASVEVAGLGPVNFKEEKVWEGLSLPQGAYNRILFTVQATDGVRRVTTTPFCAQVNGKIEWLYYRALEAMAPDVAVIPMRPSPFNETKSAVTLHSWGIQGVPCVVSRTGPYADAERAGFPALYVDHEDVGAWTTALRRLLYDRPFARELGERAMRHVLERHCFPRAVEPWEDALESAIAAKEKS